jgi:hypothetical protein
MKSAGSFDWNGKLFTGFFPKIPRCEEVCILKYRKKSPKSKKTTRSDGLLIV